jgi:hypothetical protein
MLSVLVLSWSLLFLLVTPSFMVLSNASFIDFLFSGLSLWTLPSLILLLLRFLWLLLKRSGPVFSVRCSIGFGRD